MADVDTFTRSSTYNRLGQILRPHCLHNRIVQSEMKMSRLRNLDQGQSNESAIYVYIDESHVINFKLLNFPIAFKLPFRIRKLPINC